MNPRASHVQREKSSRFPVSRNVSCVTSKEESFKQRRVQPTVRPLHPGTSSFRGAMKVFRNISSYYLKLWIFRNLSSYHLASRFVEQKFLGNISLLLFYLKTHDLQVLCSNIKVLIVIITPRRRSTVREELLLDRRSQQLHQVRVW